MLTPEELTASDATVIALPGPTQRFERWLGKELTDALDGVRLDPGPLARTARLRAWRVRAARMFAAGGVIGLLLGLAAGAWLAALALRRRFRRPGSPAAPRSTPRRARRGIRAVLRR